jgi:hypothetical protein
MTYRRFCKRRTGDSANDVQAILQMTVQAILQMRLSKTAGCAWVFPAPTKTGHIEPSSLKSSTQKSMSEATRILREEIGDPKRTFASFDL